MIRLYYKLFVTRVLGFHVESYCKHCGRIVHDYSAPDEIWEKVEPHIKHGHILCYDCFCEVCYRLGLPCVWQLEMMK